MTSQRVLVVGASRGIGAAIARAFGATGASVAVGGRSGDGLTRVAAEIEAVSGRASIVALDLRDPASVDAGVDAAAEAFGGLDVVVASGGISPVLKRLEHLAVDEWDEIMATNSRGAFLVARAAARHLLPQGSGSLVFVTSIYEHVGGARLSAYAASKGAVRQLARSLALEWAPRGVRVNCVAPGYVETDLTAALRADERLLEPILARTPAGRFARADEVAGAAVYLASDAARYVTGTTLFVDGGWTAG